MGKEELKKLNDELIKHLESSGDIPAFYYGPLGDKYWEYEGKKIAFCDLEPYNREANWKGIKQLVAESPYGGFFGWIDYGAPTAKNAGILICFLSKALAGESGYETATKEKIIDFMKKWGSQEEPYYSDFFYPLYNSVYFNLRLTINQTGVSKEDTAGIFDFFKKGAGYYEEYHRKFIEAVDPDILIIGGKTGVDLMNKILPDLDSPLEYDGKPSKRGKLSVFSIKHPSRIDNECISEKINFIKANV